MSVANTKRQAPTAARLGATYNFDLQVSPITIEEILESGSVESVIGVFVDETVGARCKDEGLSKLEILCTRIDERMGSDGPESHVKSLGFRIWIGSNPERNPGEVGTLMDQFQRSAASILGGEYVERLVMEVYGPEVLEAMVLNCLREAMQAFARAERS